MDKLRSINPHNQEVVGELSISTKNEVERKVASARKAFKAWRKTPIKERASYLRKLIKLLKKNKEKIAVLVTKDMGKPISQSRDDVDFEIGYLEFYVNEGVRALQDEFIKKKDGTKYEVVYEPYGVCAAIAPWNFPVSMASSGISPTILAGNTVVFKPSEYSSLSQKMFVDLLKETGLPKGVIEIVIGGGEVGRMLADQDIDIYWFTGSSVVGQEIYEKAAKKFIRATLELGGSSPAIVLKDADLDKAIENLYWARFLNCGQVCSAVKRLFVHKSIFDEVVKKMVDSVRDKKVGNPLDNSTDIGPIVSKKQLGKIREQVDESTKMGAKIEFGGRRPKGKELRKGNYYLPTVLTSVSFNMPVLKEETFGPVLPVVSFSNEKEAIEMANRTEYGLTAEIYTKDMEKGQRLARDIKSGVVAINYDDYYQPFCPIGGMKKSGMGREYGVHGVRELAQIKLLATHK